MNEEDKYINYCEVGEKIIKTFDHRPTLLMHVCCGPCACYPFLYLSEHFDLTIMYNNSNIYPESEYYKRLGELKKLISYIKRDYGYEIKLIEVPYNNEEYNKKLAPYASCREGEERCWLCYKLRMEEAYDYAEKNGFEYFTTVMTISREKPSLILNRIGKKLEEQHEHTKYFYSDFKKKKGAEKGIEIRKKYNLYYQNYCGCIYSYQDMLKREAKKQN